MSVLRPVPAPSDLVPSVLEARIGSALARAIGLSLLVLCSAICLSLVSWSASDPSLTHAAGGATRNLLGPVGAIISDLLMQMLGLAAVLLLLPVVYWAFELAALAHVDRFRSKAVLAPAAVLFLAAALSSFPTPASWPLRYGFGGVLGDLCLGTVVSILSVVNAGKANVAGGLFFSAGGMALLLAALGWRYGELVATRPEAIAPVGVHPLQFQTHEVAARPMSLFARLRKAIIPSAALRAASPSAVARGPTMPIVAVPVYSAITYPVVAETWTSVPAPQPAQMQGALSSSGTGRPLPSAYAAPHSHAGPIGAGQSHQARQRQSDAPMPYAPVYAPSPQMFPTHPAHGGGAYRQAAAHPMAAVPIGHAAGEPSSLREAGYDPGFDMHTDQASQAIAVRFAPAGAARAKSVNEPRPQLSPVAVARSAPVSGPVTGIEPSTQRFGAGFFSALTGLRPPMAEPVRRGPSFNLLKRPPAGRQGPEFTPSVMRGNARLLEDVLSDFGIKGTVSDIKPGPVVTLYEFEPVRGTKSARVVGLADDIARSMSATTVRVAVVPGRDALGIELPNVRRETVYLREILESDVYRNTDARLPMVLGKSIGGEPVVADLARMPHLLVAGTTGSGKSVGINAMILSLLFRFTPEECRMLMIDPKMLELSVYNGIPHLLAPVVTDPAKAVAALEWVVAEMEDRYNRMAQISVRSIDVYNNRVRNAKKHGHASAHRAQIGVDHATGQPIYALEPAAPAPMPYIVVVVDEFADLMATAGKEIEGAVQRLAQMARAAGIHVIMATQRPSVDIVTGTIKANFPTRISFKVASKIDSRTILNDMGAEQLLGQGDMLYSAGAGAATRVHGPFVSDEEVEAVANALRGLGAPDYVPALCDAPAVAPIDDVAVPATVSDDDLYDRAVAIVVRDQKASISYVQRRLSIGYNRAADLIERMERDGLVSAPNPSGKRGIVMGQRPAT